MKVLRSVCIVTQDVATLRDFYESVLEVSAEGDDGVSAFSTPGADLSLFSQKGLDKMVPGLMGSNSTSRCFLEFEVQDVDAEYKRLLALNVEVVRQPTTQPWGIRSVWFRDPEGNLVNFNAQVA